MNNGPLKLKEKMKDKYKSAMIVDGTHNDPTIISLENARIVFDFDREGNPILDKSILITELLIKPQANERNK